MKYQIYNNLIIYPLVGIFSLSYSAALSSNLDSNLNKVIETSKLSEEQVKEKQILFSPVVTVKPTPTPVSISTIQPDQTSIKPSPHSPVSYQVTTFVGSTFGYKDGTGTNAQFSYPQGIVADNSGNLYVAENSKIRKISSTGVVSTLAGNPLTPPGESGGYAYGIGTEAEFNDPSGLAIDSLNNIYVADPVNGNIRKISPSGIVTTFAGASPPFRDIINFADGMGTNARFHLPYALAVDKFDNIYVADGSNDKIRKITSAGEVSTIAGSTRGSLDGIGTNAKFQNPQGLTVDSKGNVFVAEWETHKIRKIDPTGLVSTFAGGKDGSADGIGTNATFSSPVKITVDKADNLFVIDSNKIRKITPAGVVTTLAGNSSDGFSDGIGTNATFRFPMGITVNSSGIIYVADTYNKKIRKIQLL
jgi:sugar lactone lactonase YvrE